MLLHGAALIKTLVGMFNNSSEEANATTVNIEMGQSTVSILIRWNLALQRIF